MPVDLEAIRKKNETRKALPALESARPFEGWQPPRVVIGACTDIDALLAEVERLTICPTCKSRWALVARCMNECASNLPEPPK